MLGEVVRFYLTNTANTRVFNVGLPGARMKLVGGDSGRYEHEELVGDGAAGAVGARRHRRALRQARASDARASHARARTYTLAAIAVVKSRRRRPSTTSSRSFAARGDGGRAGADCALPGRRSRTRRWRSSPRWTWAIPEGAVVYSCPMHPEVVSAEEGRCPSAE